MNTTTNEKMDILAKQYRAAYKAWQVTHKRAYRSQRPNIADEARAILAYREMVKAKQALMDANK